MNPTPTPEPPITQPERVEMAAAPSYYIASKTRYAGQWLEHRKDGARITSTWIDEAGEGQTADYGELAMRCLDEIRSADLLILFCGAQFAANDEELKGALIEAGMALALGKRVHQVGDCKSISRVFREHPLWSVHGSIQEAVDAWRPIPTPAPPAGETPEGWNVKFRANLDEALHRLICVHHTDAERAALPAHGNCPVCARSETLALQSALARAEAERDEALSLIRCETCGQSIVTCNCISLGSVSFDMATGEVIETPTTKQLCPVKELRDELTAARADAQRYREAGQKLADALNADALWAFDKESPESLRAEWPAAKAVGALTCGPNNCRAFFAARKEALQAFVSLTPPPSAPEPEAGV